MPERVVRVRGEATPAGAIFVGTGSGWGSPFYPGARYQLGLPGKENVPIPTLRTHVTGVHTVTSWDEAVGLYRTWILHTRAQAVIRTLAGRDLACYCRAGSTTCHTTVLLDLANRST